MATFDTDPAAEAALDRFTREAETLLCRYIEAYEASDDPYSREFEELCSEDPEFKSVLSLPGLCRLLSQRLGALAEREGI